MCFWTNASNIYADGSLLPTHPSKFFCPACAKYNRQHSVPLPISTPQSKNAFDLIHTDLLQPLPVESLRCRKYMLTFDQHKTLYSAVNLRHKKSDAPHHIKVFSEQGNTQIQRYLRFFCTEQGGKFVTGDLEAHFKEIGITY